MKPIFARFLFVCTTLCLLAFSSMTVSVLAATTAPSSSKSSSEAPLQTFNVKDDKFGALGNGVKDDSLAIQKAIDAARKTGGGIVYFPKGTYKTSKTLFVYKNTTLLGTDSPRIEKASEAAGLTVIMISSDQSNIEINGLQLANLSIAGSMGIDVGNNVSAVKILNCSFEGEQSQAININAANVTNVTIQSNLFQEVAFGVLTNQRAVGLESVFIYDNRFVNIYSDAIELNHPSDGPSTAQHIVIANNFIEVPPGFGSKETSGFGIGIAGAAHVTIVNNTIRNCRYEAIHIEDNASYIKIVGNRIDGVRNSPDTSLNSGIYIIDGDHITITDNIIHDADDYGIHLEIAPNRTAKNTIITNNTVTNSGKGGMRIAAQGSTSLIVTDNNLTDNGGHGITVSGSMSNLKLMNNTSEKNKGYGMYFNSLNIGWHISGNIMNDNQAGLVGYKQ